MDIQARISPRGEWEEEESLGPAGDSPPLSPEKTSLPPLLQCTDTSSKRVFESTTDLSGKERSMSTLTLRLVCRCAEQKPSEVLSLPGSTQPDPRPDSSVTSTEAGQVCEKGKFSLCALHSNTHTSHLSPRGWREHPTAINVRNHDILSTLSHTVLSIHAFPLTRGSLTSG